MSSLKFNVLFFATAILFMMGVSILVISFAVLSTDDVFWGGIIFLLGCLSIAGGFVSFKKITG